MTHCPHCNYNGTDVITEVKEGVIVRKCPKCFKEGVEYSPQFERLESGELIEVNKNCPIWEEQETIRHVTKTD